MIELMDHQKEWADFVLGMSEDELEAHGWPLFGEAGTGKTFPSCHVATELTNRHGGHALYVVPTRLVWNWAYEHSKMCEGVSNVQRIVIYGNAAMRKQAFKYIDTFGGVVSLHIFIGYDALRIHQQRFQRMGNITVLVADEAHAIKNRETQRSRALKSIDARFRFALTGTPVANRPDDLWSILHYLDPGEEFLRATREEPPMPGKGCALSRGNRNYFRRVGCQCCGQWKDSKCPSSKAGRPAMEIKYRRASPTWGNYETFIRRYCRMEHNGYGYKIAGGKNMDELNGRLQQFGMARWLIDDVLKLKPLVFQNVVLEPTAQEQRNYRMVQNGIISMLENAENGAISYFEKHNPLAILTYLRQCTVLTPTAFAALRGGLLDEILNGSDALVTGDHSSKEEWLLDHMSDTNGAKYIVYAHWIGACDHLMATLSKAGIKAVGIYGSHNKSPLDARRIMKQFAEDPELRVIVGNESMSEGLNFQSARYVVFFHLPWLPKDVIQFIGRARRHGQERTVIAYFLSHMGTIDEDMAAQCLDKQADSDSIFDPEFSGRSGMFNLDTKSGLIDLIRRR